MSEQNNTGNKLNSQNRIVRVVRIELVMSRTNVLKYIPSSFIPEISMLLDDIDELELHFKIEQKTISGQREFINKYC